MNKKYRVSDVAKDLGLQNKDVLDVLDKYTEAGKKNTNNITRQGVLPL